MRQASRLTRRLTFGCRSSTGNTATRREQENPSSRRHATFQDALGLLVAGFFLAAPWKQLASLAAIRGVIPFVCAFSEFSALNLLE